MVTERRACDSRTVVGARVRWCRAAPLPPPPRPTQPTLRSEALPARRVKRYTQRISRPEGGKGGCARGEALARARELARELARVPESWRVSWRVCPRAGA